MKSRASILACAVAGLVATAGCAGGSALVPAAATPGGSPAPTTLTSAAGPHREPALDDLPLVAEIYVGHSDHIFQGGDDHVTISVTNRGRDILDFVFKSPLWVEQHGLAMGSSKQCLPDLEQGLVACGPVYAGQDANFQLRAIPSDVGSWDYLGEFYDRAGNGTL